MSVNLVLQPFDGSCVACGYFDATYAYCVSRCSSATPGKFYEASDALGEPAHPHLHRVCKRCSYEWLERCYADYLETKLFENGGTLNEQ